ncbi:UNVERIFIED_CONTAM: hypothetical protein K2H54_035301 [Gekko kuhli]
MAPVLFVGSSQGPGGDRLSCPNLNTQAPLAEANLLAGMRSPSMAEPSEETPPVTQQISRQSLWQNTGDEPVALRSASSRLVVDADGERIPFGALYEQQKTIVVFVRHFWCYACKEYVEANEGADPVIAPSTLPEDAGYLLQNSQIPVSEIKMGVYK